MKGRKLEDIGFYTLSDDRARNASATSPLKRCELVLTGRCNFRCPYCRRVGGTDMPFPTAISTLMLWAEHGLSAVRFSGGEPTLYKALPALVCCAKMLRMERIAVSTNGSASQELYQDLINQGVNDFSVSLDACCAEDGDKMAGIRGAWDTVVESIKFLASKVYTTVGVVLTPDNAPSLNGIIRFADSLGVADIRVIPAAQCDDRLRNLEIDADLLAKYPILNYRVQNVQTGRPVRGLRQEDPQHCGLVLDDMAINGRYHYPCIIYMREGGAPIGQVGPTMRRDREAWYRTHDCWVDPICSRNCLDVCVDYNRKFEQYHPVQDGIQPVRLAVLEGRKPTGCFRDRVSSVRLDFTEGNCGATESCEGLVSGRENTLPAEAGASGGNVPSGQCGVLVPLASKRV